ncbi:membrane protein [Erwinia sp. 9145]|uniref:membrane protein n=1 Tax=Erwinia sp. 9145 TaxID=1500895 RepID=UPI0005589B56|nr:membrane protein [Erwinia sp. 9145]
MIYRGAGIMTLLTPVCMVLLIMWLFPDPTVKAGNTSLAQFLIGVGVGSAINTVVGLLLNRRIHNDGVHHHFFYIPMQWPALAICVICAVTFLFTKHKIL